MEDANIKKCYATPLPGENLSNLPGKLIVIEGADGSGRSTQIHLMRDWLETNGYATAEVGIKRSTLAGQDLADAMRGGFALRPTTLALFYATDFADQLEHVIIPSLRAGFIVLADRYIYTLMTRALVRGADLDWVRAVYSIALVPDAVFYLDVDYAILAERSLLKKGTLDYWESGMDIDNSNNIYDSFVRYQKKITTQFEELQKFYDFQIIDGNRAPEMISDDLKKRLLPILDIHSDSEGTASTPKTA